MIGSKLHELRIGRNFSQSELARRIGVSVKSIKNWESDVSDPCLTSLRSLTEVFNISADELIGRSLSDVVSLSQLGVEDQDKIRCAIVAYISEANKKKVQENS